MSALRPHEAPAERVCRAALAMIHTGQGDAMAAVDRLLQARPHHVPALCLRAALLVMAVREDAQAALADTLRVARALPSGRASERERRHVAAAGAWLAGDLQHALRLYGDIAREHPHDTLALRVAHFGDLQWARPDRLRDRVAAALTHWHKGMPGYGHVLGMHAFGLAEAGEHAAAERVGREALLFDADNAGAMHAVAHAFEMQGRAAHGMHWLRSLQHRWEHSHYATHLWWHLALYCLDAGDTAAALGIHDERLRCSGQTDTSMLVDASSLLWRLDLAGVAIGTRWQALADAWEQQPLGGLRPFVDAHAMLAFVGARRMVSARRLLDALRRRALHTHDLGEPIAEAALPVCEALLHFGAGDHAEAAARIARIAHLARRCGGSRAQCDLLNLTLLEARWRSGQIAAVRRLVAERLAIRPRSRFNQRLQARLSSRVYESTAGVTLAAAPLASLSASSRSTASGSAGLVR